MSEVNLASLFGLFSSSRLVVICWASFDAYDDGRRALFVALSLNVGYFSSRLNTSFFFLSYKFVYVFREVCFKRKCFKANMYSLGFTTKSQPHSIQSFWCHRYVAGSL